MPAAGLARPLRVAHLSDVHTGGAGFRERRLLERLAQAKPDLIVLTGDTVPDGPRGAAAEEAHAVHAFLRELRAPLGVFAVLGNWERWRRLTDPAFFAAAGVRLLVNEAVPVRGDFWLVGLDDALSGAPDEERACAAVPAGAFTLTALHSPAGFLRLRGLRSALVLAGHTHGGQVRVPLLPPLWLPPGSGPYVAGWYAGDGRRLYVSRGLGTSIVPVRFACRPELALHDLAPS